MTPSTAIQRPDLGLALDEFDLEASRLGFIGPKVFPVFDTMLQTANFSRVKINQLLKTYPVDRAPGAGYSRGQGEFTQDNFACKERGHEEPIDDRESKIYAYTIDAELHATQICRDVVVRELEKRVAARTFDTAVFTGAAYTTAVAVKWNVHATAVPVDNINAAIVKVRNGFGTKPNAVIMSWQAYWDLRQCQQVIDRIKYSGRDDPKDVNQQMLAALFGVDQIIVADAQYNSANEPQAAVLSDIWDPTMVMVARVATTLNLKEVCLGRIFNFTPDGGSIAGAVEEYREESKRATIIRCRMDTDEKLINKECGHLLTGVL